MPDELTVPLVLALGLGTTFYALSMQKEEPTTASTIFSIIGAAAGLISISSAIRKGSEAGLVTGLGITAASLSRGLMR